MTKRNIKCLTIKNHFMKQKLFTFLCLCLLCIGSAWAGTVTLTNAQIKAGSESGNYANRSATDGSGNTWQAFASKDQHSKATSEFNFWQIKKYASNTAYYIQTPTFPGNITSITLTVSSTTQPMDKGGNSATLYFSSSNSTAATGTGVASGTGASEITIDASSLGLKSGYITASGAIRIWEITVTYEEGNTPSISANNIDLEADATSGEISYTISNPVEGKNLTAETSTEWISNVTVDAANSKVTFNTIANAGAQREGTITLKYEGATNKNVTITQAKPTTFATLEALVAAGAPASDGKEKVKVTFENKVITKFYTSSNTRKGIYLNVGDKEIEIYCNSTAVPDDWIEGGMVSGTLADCTWKIYSGTWELCPDNWNDLSYTGPTTYQINIVPSEHGSIVATPTVSAAGLEVSLTVTPDTHYELASLSVKDKDDKEIIVNNNKFIMPASNVTVSATFAEKAKFTVTYYSLGVSVGSEQVYAGELIAGAPTPTFSGWELVGWTTNDELETSTTAPTAFELSTPITDVLNLYAVFKKTEGEGGTYVLDYEAESELSSSTGWGDYGKSLVYTAADGSEWVVKAYKNKGMQINTGKNASIKIPDCSANITSIEITCSANYAVGLSAEDYTGTETISYIVTGSNDKSQTLDCSGVSVTGGYIVAKSGSTSITKIVVNYGNATTFYTIGNKKVDISDAGWATACLPFNATITSDNATAYYVTGTNEDALDKTPVTVIKAGEGILLKSDDGAAATVTFTASTETADDASDNMMKGSLAGETFNAANTTYYILANDETNGLGFYYQGATNTTGASVTCAAGKAVLAVPTGAGIKSFFSLDDETTSIHNSQFTIHNSENDVMYNLNGQVVGKDYKGIVIVNGKKMLNK